MVSDYNYYYYYNKDYTIGFHLLHLSTIFLTLDSETKYKMSIKTFQ